MQSFEKVFNFWFLNSNFTTLLNSDCWLCQETLCVMMWHPLFELSLTPGIGAVHWHHIVTTVALNKSLKARCKKKENMLQPVLGEGFKQCCSLWRVLMVLQCLAAISPNLKQCCIAIREDSSVRETMPRGGWHCKTTNQPLEEPTSNRHEKKQMKMKWGVA